MCRALTILRHGGENRPLQRRKLGDHVEGEQGHRRGEEEKAENTGSESHQPTGHDPGDVLDRREQVLPHLRRIDLGEVEPKGVLEKLDQRLHEPGDGIHQLLKLLHEQGGEGPEEEHDHHEGDQKHHSCRGASAPPPLAQIVNRGLEGDRDE
jgi:hypothetical protein